MFDKQISLDMANSKGIGIADALVRQLSKNGPAKESSVELLNTKNTRREANVGGNVLPLHLARVKSKTENPNEQFAATSVPEKELPEAKRRFNSPEEFTQTILPYAQAAADELGVTPMVLVSQAALETGWGKSVIRHNNGSSSFNLFNIKADNRWNGDRVSKSTLEYDRGVAKYENASFRAYDSYADSFDDYVDFLRTNARYDSALQHNGDDELFIQNIHEAGYATDPNYANKVINILNRETIKEQAGINVENGDVVNGNV
jgi:flagellar protein FlgJ